MTLIRGTSLQGYVELTTALRADGPALLRAAGIPLAAAGDPEAWLGFADVVVAIESAAAITGARDFGRRLAHRQGIEVLGPVGTAARTARSVADGLVAASQYLSVYSPAIATELTGAGRGRSLLEFRIVTGGIADARQTTECAVVIMFEVVRLLVGDSFVPTAVHLPHAPVAPAADYVRDLGVVPEFSMPVAAVGLSSSDLARRVATDDPVHAVVRTYLDSVAASEQDDLDDRVLQLIRTLLPTGGVSVTLVSQQLTLHPRTLQRRLAAHGVTFAMLVDRAREDLARTLLGTSDMSLDQLSGVLGYSEQSVLTRACRRWFGTTPSAFRHEMRA